jgi:2-keto-3-deoxy-L-rhamnonate aldolase RhmA
LECVRCVRAEPPGVDGLRGVAASRDVGCYRETGSPAFVQATLDAVVMLMIEKRQAVENLEAILNVKGVDMVQFGPSDYSMSIGVPGQRGNPQVREAEEYVIKTALSKGIQPRAEINQPEDAERYLKLGVKHFSLSTDTRILGAFYDDKGGALKKMVKG